MFCVYWFSFLRKCGAYRFRRWGTSCSLPLDESKSSTEEEHAKALPAFHDFGCEKRNEMDLHDELFGFGHPLPTWQYFKTIACYLPGGQR